jgi:hypothetical protein
MIEPMLASSAVVIRDHVRHTQIIPDTMDALAALKVLRNADVLMALVHDEYGHFEGLFIPEDCKLRFRKKNNTSETARVFHNSPYAIIGCSSNLVMRHMGKLEVRQRLCSPIHPY